MRIAVSADGDNLHNKVDQRFGRCPYFLIVNLEGDTIGTFEAITNKGALQGHGAAIKAGQQLGELKVHAVITGQLGPNATSVLKKLGIKAYSALGVIKDVIVDFLEGKLQPILEIAEPHQGDGAKMKTEKDTEQDERIFFPLLDDKGMDSEISEHFGHAPFFGVYDIKKQELKIISNDLDHTDPAKSPIDQIQEAVNPTTIFAKGIGARAVGIIAQKGLCLKTGDYKTVKEVIENLDNLKDQKRDCGYEH